MSSTTAKPFYIPYSLENHTVFRLLWANNVDSGFPKTITWKGSSGSLAPWNRASLRHNPVKKEVSGSFGSDEQGFVKGASLLRTHDGRHVIVMFVDACYAGLSKATVHVVKASEVTNSDLKSDEQFLRQCEDAGSEATFETIINDQTAPLTYKLTAELTQQWPPRAIFRMKEASGVWAVQ